MMDEEQQNRTLTEADTKAIATEVIKQLRGGLIFGLGLGTWQLVKYGMLIGALTIALYGATRK